MPAEPTQKKLKRRASRKDLEEHNTSARFDGTHGRELELKRNRGEVSGFCFLAFDALLIHTPQVSCAECRR